MKRYKAQPNEIRDDNHYELPGDEVYYSRADLIAAGVLVPVPDGEACTLTHYFKSPYLVYVGEVYEPHDQEHFWKSITSNNRLCDYHDTPVQPVRLVKLEDLGC